MVTVIVLVYKNLNHLRNTILSILEQDYSGIELIVSDDCSPEFDSKAIEQWIRSLDEFRDDIMLNVRKNEGNLGLVKHYNDVIRLSTGKILIPLSCGDIFYKRDTITHIYRFFLENDCMIATARRKCQNGTLPTERQIEVLKKGGRKLVDSLCRGNFISGACIYYRRDFYDKYGLFDEHFFLVEDYPMLLRILFLGETIHFIDEATIIYESTGVSNAKSPNTLFQKDMMKIFDLVIEPNKHYVGIETYRHLKLRNYISIHTGITKWLFCLLFPDVLIMKIISDFKILLSRN